MKRKQPALRLAPPPSPAATATRIAGLPWANGNSSRPPQKSLKPSRNPSPPMIGPRCTVLPAAILPALRLHPILQQHRDLVMAALVCIGPTIAPVHLLHPAAPRLLRPAVMIDQCFIALRAARLLIRQLLPIPRRQRTMLHPQRRKTLIARL